MWLATGIPLLLFVMGGAFAWVDDVSLTNQDPESKKPCVLPEIPSITNPYLQCKLDQLGSEYRGRLAKTISGKTCQRWDSQSPHSHSRTDPAKFPETTLAEAHNYCRNPDKSTKGPWCYTTDAGTKWQYCGIPWCECVTTRQATSYLGQMSKTASGKTCQRWDTEYPHSHPAFNDDDFPDASVAEASNYCRNPGGAEKHLWCYTNDVNTEWEMCDVPLCYSALTCKVTSIGREYMGQIGQTASGRTCQRWDSQQPHRHNKRNPRLFPDGSLAAAENFCRNPDSDDDGPWCYTTDSRKRWEYCDVPKCECRVSVIGSEYKGQVNKVLFGKAGCQRWDAQPIKGARHHSMDSFPDISLEAAANYCRNPDGDLGGPWCYVDDKEAAKAFCDVPGCPFREK